MSNVGKDGSRFAPWAFVRGRRHERNAQMVADVLDEANRLRSGKNVYVLDELLKNHADGASFRGSLNREQVVVRVYVAKPSSPWRTSVVDGPGVISYTALGQGKLSTSIRRRNYEVHFAARPYAPRTLQDLIADEIIPPNRLADIGRQLAIGLRTIHNSGRSHDYLKPSNVAIDDAEGVHLLDYSVIQDASAATDEMESLGQPSLPWDDNPKQTDIYRLGYMIRGVLSHQSLPSTIHIEMLRALAIECLNVEPSRRPSVNDVLLVLDGGEVSDTLTSQQIPEAMRAEIGVRAPQLAVKEAQLDIAITKAMDHVRHTSSGPQSFRFRMFDRAERLHLLVSLALLYMRKPHSTERAEHLSKGVIISGIAEHEFNNKLDPAWEATIIGQAVRTRAESDASFERVPFELLAFLGNDSGQILSRRLELANNLRKQVLASDVWLHTEEVVAVLSAAIPDITNDEVRYMRNTGLLVSVEDHGRNLYPLFQFSASGLPYECVFRARSDVDSRGTWPNFMWWFTKLPELDDSTPAQWLRDGKNADRIAALIPSS